MMKLTFFVPESHLESVKESLFAVGAGRVGNYDRCCWQVAGMGQFRPLEGSNPAIGEKDCIETVPEWRVEMLCPDDLAAAATCALLSAHPYEMPAFDFVQCVGST